MAVCVFVPVLASRAKLTVIEKAVSRKPIDKCIPLYVHDRDIRARIFVLFWAFAVGQIEYRFHYFSIAIAK